MAKRKRSGRSVEEDDTTFSNEMALTPGAVRSMVYGGAFSDAFIVKLIGLSPLRDSEKYIQATVCDKEHSTKAIVVNKHLKSRYFFRTDGTLAYTISVKGYVTSPANTANVFLCITSCDILKVEPAAATAHYPAQARPPKLTLRIQGGTAGSFLQDKAPLFSDEDLAGSRAFFQNNTTTTTTITDFMAHYSAMNTLHHSSSSSLINTEQATQNYMSTLREFAMAQLDRQKASLSTNSEKVPQNQVNLVTSQHKTALEAALAHAETFQEFTPAVLQQWHALLCGGLEAQAGKFRSKKVQAGNTCFTPPQDVTTEVIKFCNAIHTLESRLDLSRQNPVTLAAAVMMGVLDIHPFADGNGRLARIAANWALRRAGLPFVINIFATPAQRRDYVTAIQTTRRNMNIEARGNVSEETLVELFTKSGLLLPLVQLIVEQVSRAVAECNKLVEEKSALALNEKEDKAARTFREKAAAGTCLICFDERPNVATLCCGKAVHLNCIAQWLSSRNSCPTCRTELPSLPPRVAAAAPAALEDSNDNDDTTSITEAAADDTTWDDTETTSSVEDVVAANQDDYDMTESTTEVVEHDDSTSVQEDTTTDDTVDVSPSPPRRILCSFNDCRNTQATDCSSGGCGRCCVLYGTVRCDRHNV